MHTTSSDRGMYGVPHITSIIVEENKYIRCEMTPTSVGGEQQECRGILEKKEEKQWIT